MIERSEGDVPTTGVLSGTTVAAVGTAVVVVGTTVVVVGTAVVVVGTTVVVVGTTVVVVGTAVVVVGTTVVVVGTTVVVVGTAVVVVGTTVVVVGTAVVVVGGGMDAVRQVVGAVTVLSSNVTAPVLANTRPFTLAPVSSVADVDARMVPTKVVVVPRVAELPTCQKTLHAWAPLMRLTVLPEAVVKVELGAWKMNTELGSPWPFKVTVPFNCSEEAER